MTKLRYFGESVQVTGPSQAEFDTLMGQLSALVAAVDLKADVVGGTVPGGQLPSYVDDVLSFANLAAFPGTGEAGKIYVAEDTNKTYRWSGSAYVVISETIALGETLTTAYRGDRGKTAYDHSQDITTNPHAVTKSQVGLSNVDNTSDTNKPVSTAQAAADANRQPIDADLTTIAAVDSAVAGALVTDGAGWIRKTYAQLKTALVLVKGDVGLGNVDNTSDANKPISTATQTALNSAALLDVNGRLPGKANTRSPLVVTGAFRDTYGRSLATSSGAITAGAINATAIELYADEVVTSLEFSIASSAVSPTNGWFALLNAAGTVLAVTANDGSNVWGQPSAKSLALTTPYTVPSSGLYYAAICVTAATAPSVFMINGNANVQSLLPILAAKTSLTTYTTPVSVGTTLTMTGISQRYHASVL